MVENDTRKPKSPPERPRGSIVRTLLIALVAGLLGGLGGGALMLSIIDGGTRVETPPVQSTSTPESVDFQISVDVNSAVTDTVEEVGSAVVTVITRLPGRMMLFGNPIERTSSGSGFIISTDGYIVTNNHVVNGAESLEVILADGTSLPATLVGNDPYADLAILEAEGQMPGVVQWGNSDALKPGEILIAIGSPLGDFMNTVTVGVVSATERSIELDQDFTLEGLIQTDAAINQGNSGGPLLNLVGEVVGINTLIVRGDGQGSVVAEGLGFAIASNTARAIAEQVIQNGHFARPHLGIRWVTITPSLAARYRLPVDHGIYIIEVEAGGPAEQAGLKLGDIILEIQGEVIDSDHPFQNQLFEFAPGDQISVRFQRQGEEMLRNVDLGTMSG